MVSAPRRAQKKFPKFLLYLFGVLLLAGAIWIFTRPEPPQVQLVTVERGKVEATVSNTRAGSVKACRRAKLAPPAGGQITRLEVKKGERVVANQILLELWNKDLQAQMQLAEQQLKTADLRVAEVCAVAEQSRKDTERTRQLRVRGFVSPEALERAETETIAKEASCAAARSEIAQARSRLAVTRAGLVRMVLRAPFAGIIGDISGEVGEYWTQSPPGIPTPPAIDLIDDSCMFVSAPIDAVDAAYVKVGQPARITLDAIKGKSFAGRVQRVAPYVLELEKQARTVEVEVAFDQPPTAENLLVGYSADVEIIHAVHDKVLRIPTQTLLEGKRVLVYGANGVLEERTVAAGLNNWDYTEITGGLEAGDRIVVSLDRAGVKAGARVQPETAQ